jgi:hypothetical protein
MAKQIEAKRAAGHAEVLRLISILPRHLIPSEEQIQQVTPATPAMHSKTHVWWCQVSELNLCPCVQAALTLT